MKLKKNTITRSWSLILAFSMVLTLAACGTSAQGMNASSVEGSTVVDSTTAEDSVIQEASVSETETESDMEESVEEEIKDKPTFTEEDLSGAMFGVDDKYVVSGSKNIDLLKDILFDGALIENIQYDAENVDFNTSGDYSIIFKVLVKKSALQAYLDGTYDPSTVDVESVETEEISIEKTLFVVAPEEAPTYADKDILVYTNDSTYVPKSDGSPVTVPEIMIESIQETKGEIIDTATGEPVKEETPEESPEPSEGPSPFHAASEKPTEEPSSTPTPAPASTPKPTSTPTPTPTPAAAATPTPAPTPTPHTHTWSTVAATGHYESRQVGTETVQTGTIHHDAVTHEEPTYASQYRCLACGYTCSSEHDMGIHEAFECEASYTVDVVQTGSTTVVDQEAWDEPIYEERPIYEDVWVEDTPAYEVCSECGATR